MPTPPAPFADTPDPLRRLALIMTRLQQPGGCPWDLKQTHESLRPYMIEECYEAIEAIDSGDHTALCEELGDVLLQVMFHSVLAARTHATFTIDDVARTASEKMIRRHPHVFGDTTAETADEVLINWERLKQQERTAQTTSPGNADLQIGTTAQPDGVLSGVPRALPALLQAQRMSEKAARVGFDWPATTQVLDKIEEEIRELRAELTAAGNADLQIGTTVNSAAAPNTDRIRDELGDLIFSLVNLARHLDIDAENALRGTCDKFRHRFAAIETHAHTTARPIQNLTLDEMETAWQAAKKSATRLSSENRN